MPKEYPKNPGGRFSGPLTKHPNYNPDPKPLEYELNKPTEPYKPPKSRGTTKPPAGHPTKDK